MKHDQSNPPAFPATRLETFPGNMHTEVQYPGMTLRDYFIAHAPPLPTNADVSAETIARWRGVYADAQLTERMKS